jgi:hypothetical protein
MIEMDTKRVERLWQAVLNVAVAMKQDGIDTGDAAKRLRDAKVLLNHCIYDEHAHGDELMKAEWAVEEVQGYLISILEKTGREKDFSFELPNSVEKKQINKSLGTPKNIPKTKSWLRISIPNEETIENIAGIEGVEIIERNPDSVTIAGDKDSLQKVLAEFSKVFKK